MKRISIIFCISVIIMILFQKCFTQYNVFIDRKISLSTCFNDGEVELCKRRWLKKGDSPLQEINVCWMFPRPKMSDSPLSIDCSKYDEIKNAVEY